MSQVESAVADLGGVTTRFLLGGLNESTEGGTVTLTNVDGPAGDVAQYAGPLTSSSAVSILHYDAHGNAVTAADAAGARTSSWSYEAFGGPREPPPPDRVVDGLGSRAGCRTGRNASDSCGRR